MPISTQMDLSGRFDAEGRLCRALTFVTQPYVVATVLAVGFNLAAAAVCAPPKGMPGETYALLRYVGAGFALAAGAIKVGFAVREPKYPTRIETQPEKNTKNTEIIKSLSRLSLNSSKSFFATTTGIAGICMGIEALAPLPVGLMASFLAPIAADTFWRCVRHKNILEDKWVVEDKKPIRKKEKAKAKNFFGFLRPAPSPSA